MRATAIVPVKRFGAAKSRLAGSAAAGIRPELARAMLSDVLAALARSRELVRTIVVSGEPAARKAAETAGADWLDDPSDAGHSEAASHGASKSLASGAACVAILPADCPLMEPAELDGALAEMATGVAGVIPDRHGTGTNGLFLSPPDVIRPAFGPGSRERHLGLARAAGAEPRVLELPSLALDLDTDEDLLELARQLKANPDLAPATAAALAPLNAGLGIG